MANKSLLVLTIVLACAAGCINGEKFYGFCSVMPNKNYDGPQVTGDIKLTQEIGHLATLDEITIEVNLKGFDPTKNKLHGFHVHQHGDLSNGCQSTGGHYNPFGKNHGAPDDMERHVGDLGNVEVDSEGNVNTVIKDEMIHLVGKYSVMGRAIVIHEGTDDLGRKGGEGSMTTGNAGPRMACCVIGTSPGPK